MDICFIQRSPGSLPARNARYLKSRHTFVPAAQHLISSSDDNNRNAALWTGYQWIAELLENTTRLRTFIHEIGTHPELAFQEQRGSDLTASAPVSDVYTPAYTKGVWSLLRLVCVVQINRPLTILSSNFHSSDVHVDCMSLRVWMMQQSPGCLTLARNLVRPSSGLKELSCRMKKTHLQPLSYPLVGN